MFISFAPQTQFFYFLFIFCSPFLLFIWLRRARGDKLAPIINFLQPLGSFG